MINVEKEESLKVSNKDTGSCEVQIELLSKKITYLSEHFKVHKKDKHSARGLVKAVNQRKNLLKYLKRKKPESYDKIINKLNIRK